MSGAHDAAIEDLETIRSLFPSKKIYERLVKEGAMGDEEHRINGDDLASACWALNNLFRYFGEDHIE